MWLGNFEVIRATWAHKGINYQVKICSQGMEEKRNKIYQQKCHYISTKLIRITLLDMQDDTITSHSQRPARGLAKLLLHRYFTS